MKRSIAIRSFWIEQIEAAWARRSVLWLAGVRRTGKTTLLHSLPGIEFFDCELPGTRRLLEDPERFLRDRRGVARVAIDEIHLLDNPSELLKIAADYFPELKVVATGSSTLAATAKFRDTLTDRKESLTLTPMIRQDVTDFGSADMKRRLYHGGLPPFFLAPDYPVKSYEDWLSDYWAKDIQELFRLQNRHSFLKFVGLLFAQSGGLFEASAFASPCGVSHVTIGNYLQVLEDTFVASVVRPYTTRRSSEIVSAPKVFGFDTGFVCAHKNWSPLRAEDYGTLWEHFVLNELQGSLQRRTLHYWRDKRGHEIDFVWAPRGHEPVAIECKWSADDFSPADLAAFRRHYPKGANYVVCENIEASYTRQKGSLEWRVVGLKELLEHLAKPA